jgi:uncharacterized membrane protein (UPF0136 family)
MGSVMLDLVRIYFILFGLLSIAGGFTGFVRAKSRASLVAGAAAGALLLFAGFLLGTTHAHLGLYLAGLLSVALAGRFVPSFLKTRKPMPAGMMAGLSVAGVALSVLVLALR